MEFETRIINGKPSIFYKNDVQKPSTKKLNTKSVKAKKEIKKSMEISGEEDKVKPSPRLNEYQNDAQLKMIFSALNQNGVKLSQNQINSLLEQIQKSQQPLKNNSFEPKEQITHKNNYYGQEESISSHSKFKKSESTIANFESNVNESEFDENKLNMNNDRNRLSLIEKKKLKWQQDKDLLEKLNQQENYDSLKSVSPKRFYPNSFSNQVQKENFQNDLVPNKLSLTEKKKIQWQKEREEREKRELEQRKVSNEIIRYNQNAFNSSPETKTSNEIADFLMKKKTGHNIQSDLNKFGGSIKNLEYDPTKQESLVNLLRKSNSLNSLDNSRNLHIETNNIQDEISDKKKFMTGIEKERNTLALSDDYNYKNSNKIDQLEEFKRIKQQIDEITAVENSLKSEEKNLTNNSKFEENKIKLDQSRVPPAMRTSISFGGVTYDDEIKKAKELERKKWLQELEEQKKGKIIEMKLSPKQKFPDNLSPFTQEQKTFEEKSFGRTRNLLDPAQIDELERKKKQSLQHKLDIEAQIAEKKRIKMIEEEIQNLNNIKIESEALELKETSKLNEERKKQNLHYQNFEKILNSSRQPETDVSPSVLQGEYNKYDQETKTMRSNITETRSQEIYRKMQEAELAAAEEKHKKLLKRLQKGGHDTSQLERKFSELKAKLTGNPEHLIREVDSQTANNMAEFKFMESSRTNNNKSHLSERNTNEVNFDKGYGYTSNRMVVENKDRKSDGETIQRLFKLLRENTAGLPAEITNDDLRLLLKNVDNTKENLIDRERNNYDQRELKNKFEKSNEMSEKVKTGIGKDGKPIWNYKNPKGKKAVSNSQKDPFYAERAQKAEERKNKRIEYYKNFNQREKIRSKEKRDNMHSNRSDLSNEDNVSLVKMDNVGVGENFNVKSTKNEKKMQNESIMNLLSKNLANNPIYEEDEDFYLKDDRSINKSDLKIKDDFFTNQENSNYGFVPFMRTNEILDPVHAGSPVPPSRESSATKRDREKARQAYIQNMRPSDYGYTYDGYSNRSHIKDPLLNNGLVKNNPTPRQEQILNQLASLKQSLMNKQKEIASSIYNDSNENFD